MTREISLTRRSLIKRIGVAGIAILLGGALVARRATEGEAETLSYLPGFNDDFLVYATSDIADTTMSRVASCGGRCVRFGVDWGVVQAEGPDQFDFTPYDQLYIQVLSHGLQLLPTVTGCPDWADPVTTTKGLPGSTPQVPPPYYRSCDPRHDHSFGRFVDATLQHFDAITRLYEVPPVISGVEITNEPNIWNIGEMPASRLRELASAAASEVARSQEAGAFSGPMRVISGGISSLAGLTEPDVLGNRVHPPWEDYLTELVADGPVEFDVGFHSYEISKPPAGTLTVPETDPAAPHGRMQEFAEWQASEIVARIDRAAAIVPTDIWVTETGASSASIWSTDIFSPTYRAVHGEAIQAYVLALVASALESEPRVRSMLVHRLYSDDEAEPPPTPDSDSAHYQDGVYDSIDGNPKAAVATLTQSWS